MSQSAPGARSSSRRIRVDALAVLALVLPLLTVGALLLVHPRATTTAVQAPTRTPLSTATVACPSALAGGGSAAVATAQDRASGRVRVAPAGSGQGTSAPLRSGRPTPVRGDRAALVTAQGALAPGLLGARFGAPGKGVAASSCPPPVADQWFTGVGAGPKHSSTLELVNPDAGRAVADVTVLGPTGPLDVGRLRGVAVLGHSSVRLDLGALTPRRGDLALRVVTSRGRLSATVLDSVDELGAGRSSQDWLPAQAAPTSDSLLLGLAPGAGSRTLVVANPGESEVRVQLKVVSDRSSYAPAGADEIRVPPGSTTRVSVDAVLRTALRRGALGLQLVSSGPVTASLRSFLDGDLSATTAAARFDAPTATLLPGGRARLVLSGAETAGGARVTGWSRSGRQVLARRVEVTPGRGTALALPPTVSLLAVDPGTTSMSGGVLVAGRGAATVLPLPELVRNGLVPAVRPGLS